MRPQHIFRLSETCKQGEKCEVPNFETGVSKSENVRAQHLEPAFAKYLNGRVDGATSCIEHGELQVSCEYTFA